ncbi:MAG: thioredoxin TrxC [Pseudomonadota bacterium]
MAERLHLVCSNCGSVNRVPGERLAEDPKCGKCSRLLLDGRPAALDRRRFETFVGRNDLPVVVDFWAAWCGPCKMMAPVFERLAGELAQRARFAKVDTDAEQELAQRHGIRGIPTLILFRHGAEADRLTGAADAAALRRWLESRGV